MSSPDTDLRDTQTQHTDYIVSSQEIEEPKIVYGKLMSIKIYLPSIVLDKPEFILGRDKGCDVVITKNNFARSVDVISKNHFRIHCDPNDNTVVFITDLSKNGTFVNSVPIGKNKTVVLKHKDLISIGTSESKVYVFNKINLPEYAYLPVQLKDKYEFIDVLGNGACGEVLLVRDLFSQEQYALKKINKGKSCHKDNLNNPSRIKNEIKILESVSHPCIVSSKEIIETDEAVYIILEYMAGGELTDLVMSSPTPLPESVAKLLFYQIVLGLRYLHLRNIIHRDLKPSNILLQSKGLITLVKIADFGLSKIMESSSGLDTCCGTPCYIAPEVIDPRCGSYTMQVDVWSLGVILFYMLSKELPFQAESNNPNDIIRHIVFGTYRMSSSAWNSVSGSAKDLISRMLKKNPEERYSVHEVADHPWLSKDLGMQEQVKVIVNKYNEAKKVSKEFGAQPPTKKLKVD